MKIYGVIMAGGGGTRFWPLSRQKTPKQLLNLSGKERMVNETIDRLSFTVDKKDMFVVTNAAQAEAMADVTDGRLQKDHILSEPAGRNTAACIGYAAFEIIKKYGDGIMVITPSDAYIKDVPAFTRVLATAVKTAEQTDRLVTIGITPTFPATGYGYIKYNANTLDGKLPSEDEVYTVEEFKEKPDLETAKEYVDSGSYAWNSGMFIWKASTILNSFRKFLPGVYADLSKIADAMGTEKEKKIMGEIYPNIESISIDYGIMERSSDVVVVPGEFGWNDVGSWDMMNVLHEQDAEGNILLADHICFDTKNTTVYSEKRLITTVGVDNLVIVDTSDAIMVCTKDSVQNVKKIVEKLKADGRVEYL